MPRNTLRPAARISLGGAEAIGESAQRVGRGQRPGIAAGREEAVFQKFTRGERESATPGVGLGLAICRAIIESHQGKITAAHRPGGGAIFTFTLPLGHAAAGRRTKRRPSMAEPLPVAILIEDERQIRRFVRTALEAEGWSVHEAETLRQGLSDAAPASPT